MRTGHIQVPLENVIRQFDQNETVRPSDHVWLHVKNAFARPMPDITRISLSLPLIVVVTASITVKVAVLLFLLLSPSSEPPLVTIGDAICSFLTHPDKSTAKHRIYSHDDYLKLHAAEKENAAIEKREIKKGHVSGCWQPRVRRYLSSRSRLRWLRHMLANSM